MTVGVTSLQNAIRGRESSHRLGSSVPQGGGGVKEIRKASSVQTLALSDTLKPKRGGGGGGGFSSPSLGEKTRVHEGPNLIQSFAHKHWFMPCIISRVKSTLLGGGECLLTWWGGGGGEQNCKELRISSTTSQVTFVPLEKRGKEGDQSVQLRSIRPSISQSFGRERKKILREEKN